MEAIPTRVFDLFGKIQVHLKSTTGAKLPLSRHGEGTQSLSVLMLFQAYVATKLAEDYKPESTPILALEEPEAHLHPSAIRSLGSLLENMVGQTIVSSHSGDLLSRVPVTSLRRLYKKNGETKIGRVQDNLLTDREIQAVNYFIRLSKGHYLFSRCWLLVEGESDFHIMPMLFELMGYSQDQISFSVLEFSQVFEKGESFIKLAQALGIQRFMMADGDAAGRNYVNRAGRYLENGENLADRARQLTSADIEHEFWNAGYDDVYKNVLNLSDLNSLESQHIPNQEGFADAVIKKAIKERKKPGLAMDIQSAVTARGINSIPQTIKDIITHVVQLAGN